MIDGRPDNAPVRAAVVLAMLSPLVYIVFGAFNLIDATMDRLSFRSSWIGTAVKRPTIIVFLLSVLFGSFMVYSLRHARNDWYEYCTTRAFGWPFAWRIDNCECDGRGGQTEFPSSALAMNLAAVVAVGIVTASLYHFLSGLRTR